LVNFLIIRFSSIGDIVLTTPVIRCLKKQVEGARIHYLTKQQFAPVIAANPHIDKIHILEDSLHKVISRLKHEPVDYIIDLHRNIRSSIVKIRLRRMSFSFNKINLQKWLLVNFKINRLPDKHIVDRYLETVRLFDIKNDGEGLDYFIPPEEEVDVSALPRGFSEGYVAMVVGAKHATKQLPPDKLLALCDLINKPVVLLGGPEDRQLGETIAARSASGTLNACGRYSINQSASLIRQSRVVITPDTGLMHIASAFKKRIISVWGNTIPELGMQPYFPGEGSAIFEVRDLYCRPCSKIGYPSCPKKHFRCMTELNERDIAEKALALF
jgi:ADP-heptose:LPS heptosyltransferase